MSISLPLSIHVFILLFPCKFKDKMDTFQISPPPPSLSLSLSLSLSHSLSVIVTSTPPPQFWRCLYPSGKRDLYEVKRIKPMLRSCHSGVWCFVVLWYFVVYRYERFVALTARQKGSQSPCSFLFCVYCVSCSTCVLCQDYRREEGGGGGALLSLRAGTRLLVHLQRLLSFCVEGPLISLLERYLGDIKIVMKNIGVILKNF